MANDQGVYKTNITCEIGYSICTPTGDWEKSRVAFSSDVGPGYPNAELISWVCKQQLADATRACEEQIETIANKIVQQVQFGQ